MKLIDSRIRVEKSEHITRYFPELLYSRKNWFGKEFSTWVRLSTSHIRRSSVPFPSDEPYDLRVAKVAIDLEWKLHKQQKAEKSHTLNKEIEYIKYP